MKTKAALFLVDFFDNGRVKYAKGKTYPLDDETERRIKLGDAEEIEVDATDGASLAGRAPAGGAQKAQRPAPVPRGGKAAAAPSDEASTKSDEANPAGSAQTSAQAD